MNNMNKLIGAMFIALVLAFNLQAGDTDAKRLFISLSSGDFKQSGTAVAIANAMQDAGVKTTVFLNAKSVQLAVKSGSQEKFGPTNTSVKDMLKSLIKKGGTVMVCGMSAKFQEVKQSDIIKGASIITGAEVYGGLFAPNTQTLSY